MSENKIKLYAITKHCKERYAERVANQQESEIVRYVNINETEIQNNISKMINDGECIFVANRTSTNGKTMLTKVILSNQWILLLDAKNDTVITLFKIELGLGDDFNNEYISRMMDKINSAKEEKTNIQMIIDNENEDYKNKINANLELINEYKNYIKQLETINISYKTIIDNNIVKRDIANNKIGELVNSFIGKKEF